MYAIWAPTPEDMTLQQLRRMTYFAVHDVLLSAFLASSVLIEYVFSGKVIYNPQQSETSVQRTLRNVCAPRQARKDWMTVRHPVPEYIPEVDPWTAMRVSNFFGYLPDELPDRMVIPDVMIASRSTDNSQMIHYRALLKSIIAYELDPIARRALVTNSDAWQSYLQKRGWHMPEVVIRFDACGFSWDDAPALGGNTGLLHVDPLNAGASWGNTAFERFVYNLMEGSPSGWVITMRARFAYRHRLFSTHHTAVHSTCDRQKLILYRRKT